MLAAARACRLPAAAPLRPQPATARRLAVRAAAGSMERVDFGSGYGWATGPKDAPAVIVLQEWWGVNDIIKEHAALIAAAGPFRTLVPDLYKGKVGVDAEEASHLMGALDFKAAVAELRDAAAHLRASGAPAVGVVGFCMGGALAFAAAQHAAVECAAPFYGIPDPAICDPTAIKVPVQAHFGELDTLKGFSDPESIAAVVSKMQAAGAGPVELLMFPNSGHAFMNALTEKGRAKIKAAAPAAARPAPAPEMDSDVEFEAEWETVQPGGVVSEAQDADAGDITIQLGDGGEGASDRKRKGGRPYTKEERQAALEVHRVHTLCLLAHAQITDQASSSPELQALLLSIVPPELLDAAGAAASSEDPAPAAWLPDLLRWFHRAFATSEHPVQAASAARRRGASWQEDLASDLGLGFAPPGAQLAACVAARRGSAAQLAALLVALLRGAGFLTRSVWSLDPLPLRPAAVDALARGKSINPARSRAPAPPPSGGGAGAGKGGWRKRALSAAASPAGATAPGGADGGGKRQRRGGSKGAAAAGSSREAESSSAQEGQQEQAAEEQEQEQRSLRKGDEEFERQLAMAMASTAAAAQGRAAAGGVPAAANKPAPAAGSPPPTGGGGGSGRGVPAIPRGGAGGGGGSGSRGSTAAGASLPALINRGASPAALKAAAAAAAPPQGFLWQPGAGAAPAVWAEAYVGSSASGRWLHVDALLGCWDRPGVVEGATARRQPLSYVVACQGGAPKDVTRRYAANFTVNMRWRDEAWWSGTMARLRSSSAHLPRQLAAQVEAGAAAAAAAGQRLEEQPLAGAQQQPDQQQQPAKRRRTAQQAARQALVPGAPKLGLHKGEPYYARADLQDVNTRPAWRRLGRDVRAEELAAPAKTAKKRAPPGAGGARGRGGARGARGSGAWLHGGGGGGGGDGEASDTELGAEQGGGASGAEQATQALYGLWQTEPWAPPAAVDGKVPRNEHGNVEAPPFAAALPEGTVHVVLPGVAAACRALGIDFAPALVGFEVQGGRNLPKLQGVVVCAEFERDVVAACTAKEAERAAAAVQRQQREAAAAWRRLLGLLWTRLTLERKYSSPHGDGGAGAAAAAAAGQQQQRAPAGGAKGIIAGLHAAAAAPPPQGGEGSVDAGGARPGQRAARAAGGRAPRRRPPGLPPGAGGVAPEQQQQGQGQQQEQEPEPPRPPDGGEQAGEGEAQDGLEGSPERARAVSPTDESGTPRAPRLLFEGRAGAACPGAPRKGRTPAAFFDRVSGEAPVRRLSFGADSDDDDMSEGAMDEDDTCSTPRGELQRPAAAAGLPPLAAPPAPQPWPAQHAAAAQHWQTAATALPSPQQPRTAPDALFRAQFTQPRQQLWTGQGQLAAHARQQQQQQEQPVCGWPHALSPAGPAAASPAPAPVPWNPLSPTGRLAPAGAGLGATTPARLFR
ncbi:RAD4 [Scenedesmus sp. PABB004]|nr:RAD4 [Scenedesmus sp. PABB004]